MFSMFGRTGAPTKMRPPHETKKTNACILTQQKQKQISCANIIINKPIIVLGALGPHIFSEQGPV